MLLNRAKNFSKNCHLFPAGVDYEKFESSRNYEVPSDLRSLPGPIAGYVGAISAVFDQKLLISAAQNLPAVNFVLIGPTYVDVSLLTKFPNIILMGARPHDDIPAYIKGFDVALIPYIKNKFTDAVYSCKLNEYLAMGAAVVASDLYEIRLFCEKHGGIIEIAANSDEFEEKIIKCLEGSSEDSKLARISIAKNNSWDVRFNNMYSVISEILNAKNGDCDWKQDLIKRFKVSRKKVLNIIFLLGFFYFLIFNSPLFWYAGALLTPIEAPKKVDAIVVFSGDGEANYINPSYQRRTLDAVNYFQAGYAPVIFLSSGRDNTISDVEIIKSLLVNRGVLEKSIEILQKYPNSTFQNVEMVKEILVSNKVKSIILITSPYHSLRAALVWERLMPELEVITPIVIDTPKSIPEWGASLNQIRVILYEYLAIIYYKYKGWI